MLFGNKKDLVSINDLHKRIQNTLRKHEYNEKDINEFIELLFFSLLRDRNFQFFGNFIIQMNRKIDRRLDAPAAVTLQQNSFTLHINPHKFMAYTIEECRAIIIHEVYHIVNVHIPRYKKLKGVYPHYYVNVAMDAAINQYIDNLPKNTITLESIAEAFNIDINKIEVKREYEYYLKLLMDSERGEAWDQLRKQIENKLNNPDDSSNDNDVSMDGSSEGEGGDGGSEPMMSPGGSDGGDEEPSGLDETGNGMGNHNIWDESEFFGGEEEINELVKSMMERAIQNSSRGNIPANILQTLEFLSAKPEIPWQEEFKRLTGSVKVPYKKTLLRRSRRMPERTDIRGRISDRKLVIKVAIDTSGSQSMEQLQFAFNEIHHILKGNKYTLEIIECDAEVQRTYEIKDIREASPDVKGGGGTYFSPVIEMLNKRPQNKRGDILIYFTDGWGESTLSEAPRGYKVLWVLKDGSDKISLNNPYGKVRNLNYDN